jgi:hypothetical protein
MCFSTARSEAQRGGDRGVGAAQGHLGQDLALTRREVLERGVGPARAGVDQRLHHLRVDHRATRRDLAHRAHELVDIGDALLQQVGAPFGSAIEQLERVAGFDVLAEHHHAELRVRVAELRRRAHAFVGSGRRHADVGEHDVGGVGLDRGDETVEVLARARDLDVGIGVEQARDGLTIEVVVLGDEHPDGHGGEAIRGGMACCVREDRACGCERGWESSLLARCVRAGQPLSHP